MTDKQRYQAEHWKLLIEDETRNEMKLKDWERFDRDASVGYPFPQAGE